MGIGNPKETITSGIVVIEPKARKKSEKTEEGIVWGGDMKTQVLDLGGIKTN